MRRLIAHVTTLVLPSKQAEATRVRGRCGAGCGTSGVWLASVAMPGGRQPCC